MQQGDVAGVALLEDACLSSLGYVIEGPGGVAGSLLTSGGAR
jgi:hypothetical protein